ncbi:MAG: glycosyltransferase [Bryobacteraceae bacterium]|nr:glycosyltransferase [Bryobacteraceae bacterium]
MTRVLIIGYRGGTHIGASLERAQLPGVEIRLIDPRRRLDGPAWAKSLSWRLLGRRPLRLEAFGRELVEECDRSRPDVLLTTGIAPAPASALAELGRMGIARANFLTDDPWNPVHRAPWFFSALRYYDFVFSPRKANLDELRVATRALVGYVPFGYDPELFYPLELTAEERSALDSDVVFAGGADADRIPYFAALIRAGLKVALYGGYWDRYRETRAFARGMAEPALVRKAFCASRLGLCLVRRGNRDGHCMRTFEVPATGLCMLAEGTDEHREIFGEDGEAVALFDDIPEMVKKAVELVADGDQRKRLAGRACRLVREGPNSYGDRLQAMLSAVTAGDTKGMLTSG